MSQLAMPLVIVNLGCEMVYILEQRLKAQNIPADKSCKVLQDVIATMFERAFVNDKLFAPQEVYSVNNTRKIFNNLAHSSIMRLSESSMDKLFDLMMMGFKYQLLCSTKLEEMLQITKLHLSTVKSIMSPMPDSSAAVDLITNVEENSNRVYGQLPIGQLHLLRHTLLRFLQDKRVKVSLFLQEGIQTSTGRIVLPSPVAKSVGEVKYYSQNNMVEKDEKLKLNCLTVDPNEFFSHPCPLGTNLYNKERTKVVPPPRCGDINPVSSTAHEEKPDRKPVMYTEELLEKAGPSARKELDLLAHIINLKRNVAGDNFKLNLFGDDDFVHGGPIGSSKVPALSFGSAGKNEAYKSGASGLADVIKGLNVDDKGSGNADLLDLLDSAAEN